MKSFIFPTLRVVTLLFCIIFCTESQAQTTTIRISAAEGSGKPIPIFPPVEGRFLRAAQWIDTLDAQGQMVIDHDMEVPGLFMFHYEYKYYRLYVRPGDTFNVVIDKNQADRPLTVLSGPFSEAQEAMNRLELGDAQQNGDQYYSLNPVFEHTRKQVLEEVERQLAPFNELHRSQQMDVDFYETVQLLVKNHYAEILCHALTNEISSLVYHPDSSRYKPERIDQARKDWESIFALADYRDIRSTRVSTYEGYHRMVQDFYVASFFPKSEGRYLPPVKRTMDYYFQSRYWLMKEHHQVGPLQEYLLASRIHFINDFKNFYDFIPELYADFTERYPNSIYIPYLKPGVDEVIAFHRKIQREKARDYIFVGNSERIADFDGLMMQHFSDQTVYVDLWASWCVPCKEEFQFSDQLHQFVASRGISVLYISIDKDHDEKQWEDMITYYDLKGHHIRATASLLTDLHKRFGNAIPRYILVKNGKILLDDMMRPSAGKELYEQIDKLVSID